MNFVDAVKNCLLVKYFDFSGRASRSEFWWYYLFSFVVINLGTVLINFVNLPKALMLVVVIIQLLIALPAISVTVRRLHDSDKSGWFYLIVIIPLIGALIMLYLCSVEGTKGPNRFGSDPLKSDVVA